MHLPSIVRALAVLLCSAVLHSDALCSYISGTISSSLTGAPIPEVDVHVYGHDVAMDRWSEQPLASAKANSAGDYLITLPEGIYRLHFTDPSGVHAPSFYGDSTTLEMATAVVVRAGQPAVDIDSDLIRSATISGNVVSKLGGISLSGIEVVVSRHKDIYARAVPVARAYTDPSGSYTVKGLSAGLYIVSFADGTGAYAPEYHDNALTEEAAKTLVLEPSQAMNNIDAALADAAIISGSVSSKASASPLGDIRITVYRYSSASGSWIEFQTGNAVFSDSSGNYVVRGLPAGDYWVGFSDPGNSFAPQFYVNAVSLGSSQVISLGEAQHVGDINAALVDGASIRGQLTVEGGSQALQGIQVEVFGPQNLNRRVYTDTNGNYEVTGLPAGSYRLHFTDPAQAYAPEVYNNTQSLGSSTSVDLGEGDSRGGVDAALALGATISGTVTSDSGSEQEPGASVGLAGIEVSISPVHGGMTPWPAGVYTDIQGRYEIKGLPAGSYTLLFRDPAHRYVSEYFDNSQPYETRTRITLTTGQTRGGVNAVLTSAATITGIVTSEAGAALEGAEVRVYCFLNGDWVPLAVFGSALRVTVYTDSNGVFTVTGLPAGTYRLAFSDPSRRYAPEYNGNALTLDGATDIRVSGGVTVSNVDATLSAAASISGNVSSSLGDPLAGIFVYVFSNGPPVSTYTDASGNYTVAGLAEGSCRVSFAAGSSDYAPQYYQGANTFNSATPVLLATGQNMFGIDAILAEASTISGKVSAKNGGLPIQGVSVSAYSETGGQVAYTYADPDGNYTLSGLPAGSYKVHCVDWNNKYVATFYRDEFWEDSAELLPVAVGQDLAGIDFALSEASSISGQVTADAGGAPLGGVSVTAYQLRNGVWQVVGGASTELDGTYEVVGLPPGNTILDFQSSENDYAWEYYGDVLIEEAAIPRSLSAGQHLPHIDASLAEAGVIKGNVCGPSGGTPLPGIRVQLYRFEPLLGSWIGNWRRSAVFTDAVGNYEFKGLPAGDYRVEFRDSANVYGWQYHANEFTLEMATPIRVDPGDVEPGIDAQLALGATITGMATAQATGLPLEGMKVEFYRYDSVRGYWAFVWPGDTVLTDASGNYEVKGFPAGDYRVKFRDPANVYGWQYHSGKFTEEMATPIKVDPGDVESGIDAQLALGATITGTVTAQATGLPLEGMEVQFYRYDEDLGYWAFTWTGDEVLTDAAGNYEVSGLPAGQYRVEFRDPANVYGWQYYGGGFTEETATPIRLDAGEVESGIDAQLALGATITGTVTAQATGLPLQGMEVQFYRYDAVRGYWAFIWTGDMVQTDASGNYEVKGLPAGDYRVEFRDPANVYGWQYHANEFTEETAMPIRLDAGELEPGIGAQLALGATITGTVTAQATGLPLQGMEVQFYRYDAVRGYWAFIWTGNTVQTDASGNYEVKGLPSGRYRVVFRDPANVYGWQYYGGGFTEETASPIDVGAGEVKPGIDVQLALGATITGTVTAQATGLPLEGMEIQFYRYDEGLGYWAFIWTGDMVQTDASGNYEVKGLPAGDYRVEFRDPANVYGWQYHANEFTEETATPIRLDAGEVEPGIDAQLALGATITGTVTAQATGLPLQGMEVQFYRYDAVRGNWALVWTGNTVLTDASGNYEVKGLPAGDYALVCTDGSHTYATRFYSSNPSVEDVTPVTLRSGQLLQEINIALQEGLMIGGSVVAESGGIPLAGIEVELHMLVGGIWIEDWRSSVTDKNGMFSLAGLSPATYRLKLLDPSGMYATEYYLNASSGDTASPIPLPPGDDLSLGQLVMGLASAVSGRVTGPDGVTPLASVTVVPYRRIESSPTWERLESSRSLGDGTFEFRGLPPGLYTFEFIDEMGTHIREFYNNKPNLAAAESVPLSAGVPAQLSVSSLQLDGFNAWMATNGLSSAPNNGVSDDFDGDGWSNGAEHAFGTNPAKSDRSQATAVRASGNNVVLEFLKLNKGASYSIQERSDLKSGAWLNSSAAMSESPDQTGVGIGYTRMRCTVPATGRKFFRVLTTY